MNIINHWKRLLWHLDRSADAANPWRLPLFALLLFLLLFLAIFLPLPALLHPPLRCLIALTGSAAITTLLLAVTIPLILLRRRNYALGNARYFFNNHILILGGSLQVANILRTIANDQTLCHKDILILASTNIPYLRDFLRSHLSPAQQQLSITLYHGQRTLDSTLRSCQIENASHIFILGEDNEPSHDNRNISCWNTTRHLRSNAIQMAQCLLYLRNNISSRLLQSLPQESHTSLETTVVNPLESIAQQLLVGDSPDSEPYTLDRGLVNPDSQRYVHLIIVGMTPMGYAFASAAAQLCHFPNFNPTAAKPIRTRITFIDPLADQKIDYFKAHYHNLFQLSHVTLRCDNNGWQSSRPDPSFGDFLDIEWEFLKGSIVQEWIRQRLSLYAQDPLQIISVALCGDNPDSNISDAFNLPPQYFPLDDVAPSSAVTPLVFVFQPDDNSLVHAVHNDVPRYHNVVPFGFSSSDPLLNRRIAAAKRINFLYQRINSGKQFTAMSSDSNTLDDMWRQLSFTEKASTIHAANAIYLKFRNLGLSNLSGSISDQTLLNTLARIEHNRWMMEKLLAGYSALPAAQRNALNNALLSNNEQTQNDATIRNKRNTSLRFANKDITPFDDLPADVQQTYRDIVCNLYAAV